MKYIYKNKLDKACFSYDTAYADSKDLAMRTVSDKVLKDSPYEISLIPKYDGYQRELGSMVYKFFDEKIGSDVNVNEVLVQELHKPVNIEFK